MPGLQRTTQAGTGERLARRVRTSASPPVFRGPKVDAGGSALPSMPGRYRRGSRNHLLRPRRTGRVHGGMRTPVRAQPVEQHQSLRYLPSRTAVARHQANRVEQRQGQAQLHRRSRLPRGHHGQQVLRLRRQRGGWQRRARMDASTGPPRGTALQALDPLALHGAGMDSGSQRRRRGARPISPRAEDGGPGPALPRVLAPGRREPMRASDAHGVGRWPRHHHALMARGGHGRGPSRARHAGTRRRARRELGYVIPGRQAMGRRRG